VRLRAPAGALQVEKAAAEEVRAGTKEAAEVKPTKKDEEVAANKKAEEVAANKKADKVRPAPKPAPSVVTPFRLCSVCLVPQPKEAFSKKQWGLNDAARKCSECVADAVASRDDASERAAKAVKAPRAKAKFYILYELAWVVGLFAALVWLMYDENSISLPPS